MRAVLDTNVLVSAIWSEQSKPADIIEKMLAGVFEPVYDGRILAEYREVLTRSKFAFDEQRVDTLLKAIELLGTRIEPAPCDITMPDESDRAFYEVAITADALLVTGNLKHFPGLTNAITPAEFIGRLV